ncbi:K+ -transporting ATPase [Rodentibacter pneumotropicus]|uniref:K+ -transporting ATPase n=1 Tax=Rodentibacter pneumotropicus TaxID=758 RepID=A0A448MTS9_9PAST|nr:K+ -transporting ATPase [Rodentibacter pneumotropicus]
MNQRYLENFFRLPEQFRGLENALREKLRQNLTRGKIECSLRIESKNKRTANLILIGNLQAK